VTRFYRVDEFDDGYVDLTIVKDFTVGCGAAVDVSNIAKLQTAGRTVIMRADNCFTLLFGTCVTDNRTVEFLMPPRVAGTWQRGLGRLVRAVHRHNKGCTDRRLYWLKEQFLQLYFYEGRCHGPTLVEAMRVCMDEGIY